MIGKRNNREYAALRKTNEWLSMVEAEAIAVFGSFDQAWLWIESENNALGGTPLSLLKSKHGAVEVRKVLRAIAYGGVV